MEDSCMMTIRDQLIDTFDGEKGKVFISSEIRTVLKEKFGTNPGSVIPSDYCYNRINIGIKFDQHLFEYLEKGRYKYLGAHYPYTGKIFQKPQVEKVEKVVGEWKRGKKKLF